MHVSDAMEYVSSLAVRPGWKLLAYQASSSYIGLGATFDTVESDGADAPNYYRKFRRMVLPVIVDVSNVDSVELTRIVLEYVTTAETHEWREYLRTRDDYSGTWTAPLHPHTHAGSYNYQITDSAAKRFHASHPDYEG